MATRLGLGTVGRSALQLRTRLPPPGGTLLCPLARIPQASRPLRAASTKAASIDRIASPRPTTGARSNLSLRRASTDGRQVQPDTRPGEAATSQSSSPPSPSTPAPKPPILPVATVDTSQKTPDATSIYKLVSLAFPQWRLISIGVSCMVVSTGVSLTVPWAIGRIIDFFAPGSEATLLFGLPLEQATAALAGFLLFGAVANSGRSICLRLAGQRTVAAIRWVECPLMSAE